MKNSQFRFEGIVHNFSLSKILVLLNFTLYSIPGHALVGIYEYLSFYR